MAALTDMMAISPLEMFRLQMELRKRAHPGARLHETAKCEDCRALEAALTAWMSHANRPSQEPTLTEDGPYACWQCGGAGVTPYLGPSGAEIPTCSGCDGTGWLKRCPHCDRMGWNIVGESATDECCEDCDGAGVVSCEAE